MTLREWITQNSMTQRQAAELLGVHEITLNRYVTGKQIPRRATMMAISKITSGAVCPIDFYGTRPAEVAA